MFSIVGICLKLVAVGNKRHIEDGILIFFKDKFIQVVTQIYDIFLTS